MLLVFLTKLSIFVFGIKSYVNSLSAINNVSANQFKDMAAPSDLMWFQLNADAMKTFGENGIVVWFKSP